MKPIFRRSRVERRPSRFRRRLRRRSAQTQETGTTARRAAQRAADVCGASSRTGTTTGRTTSTRSCSLSSSRRRRCRRNPLSRYGGAVSARRKRKRSAARPACPAWASSSSSSPTTSPADPPACTASIATTATTCRSSGSSPTSTCSTAAARSTCSSRIMRCSAATTRRSSPTTSSCSIRRGSRCRTTQIRERLAAQAKVKPWRRLQTATRGYDEFLRLGGKLALRDLEPSLLRRHTRPRTRHHRLERDVPLPGRSRHSGDERRRRRSRRARRTFRRAHGPPARCARDPDRRSARGQSARAVALLCGAGAAADRRHPARHHDVRREPARHRAEDAFANDGPARRRPSRGVAAYVCGGRGHQRGRLSARRALRRPAPGARLQPLRLLRVPNGRLLRLAARGGARPPHDARRRDDPGREVALAAARRRRARGDRRALAAHDQIEALRAQHLLRLQHRGAACRRQPRAVQSVPDAADAGDVREVLDDRALAAAQHHADPGRRHSEGPRRLPAPGHREPLRAARPGGPRRTQRPVRARPCDPDEPRRALAAVEPRGPEALRARRAGQRFRRRVPEPRRLRPHRRVRRAVHPRDDGRQPPHVPVRQPGARRRARRHRRPGIDHPLRQQGLPGRARETARSRDPADDGRDSSTRTDEHHPRARPAVRAEAARQRVLAGRVPRRHARGAAAGLERLLSRSDLVVVQSFMPTEFDWRVGVFDRQPLFVCRYFMAEGHWQIYHHGEKRTKRASPRRSPCNMRRATCCSSR